MSLRRRAFRELFVLEVSEMSYELFSHPRSQRGDMRRPTRPHHTNTPAYWIHILPVSYDRIVTIVVSHAPRRACRGASRAASYAPSSGHSARPRARRAQRSYPRRHARASLLQGVTRCWTVLCSSSKLRKRCPNARLSPWLFVSGDVAWSFADLCTSDQTCNIYILEPARRPARCSR